MQAKYSASTGKAEEKIRQESSWCKSLQGGRLCMGISERYTTERNKKAPKKWRGPFMITEVHQEGRFYRLSTGRAAHYENIKPHNPSTEDWCIPADMEEGDNLMMDPACEVNEKGTREKNDGSEVVEEGTNTPLDLDPNEVIGADDETLP